jgi:hypothetical protein
MAFEKAGLIKHALTVFEVKLANLCHRHTPGQACGNDGAGACSCDVIKVVRQDEVRITL